MLLLIRMSINPTPCFHVTDTHVKIQQANTRCHHEAIAVGQVFWWPPVLLGRVLAISFRYRTLTAYVFHTTVPCLRHMRFAILLEQLADNQPSPTCLFIYYYPDCVFTFNPLPFTPTLPLIHDVTTYNDSLA